MERPLMARAVIEDPQNWVPDRDAVDHNVADLQRAEADQCVRAGEDGKTVCCITLASISDLNTALEQLLAIAPKHAEKDEGCIGRVGGSLVAVGTDRMLLAIKRHVVLGQGRQ